jgi:hypothetical protein
MVRPPGPLMGVGAGASEVEEGFVRRGAPPSSPPLHCLDILKGYPILGPSYHLPRAQHRHRLAKMSKLTRLGRGARQFNLGVPASLLALAGALMLSSCANTTNLTDLGNKLGNELPTAVGGMPEGAPERPQTQPNYPAVHDMPPARNTKVMTEEEKKRLETELAAMREQQNRRAQSAAANPN